MKSEKSDTRGHRGRLRERFMKSGLEAFADYEVVELLLTLAIPRCDVKEQAKALISRFGSLRGILDAPLESLRKIPGLGDVAPVALKIIREAAALYLKETAEEKGEAFTEVEALSHFLRLRIGALPNEVFCVIYLDNANRLLKDGFEIIEEGTIDRAAVFPRRVVENALRRGAAALAFAHNHPSGELVPSEQDRTLTRALVLAAGTVQIRVLDHLVVTPDRVLSFRQEGLL